MAVPPLLPPLNISNRAQPSARLGSLVAVVLQVLDRRLLDDQEEASAKSLQGPTFTVNLFANTISASTRCCLNSGSSWHFIEQYAEHPGRIVRAQRLHDADGVADDAALRVSLSRNRNFTVSPPRH
jgi:hypothetical protein